MSRHENDYKLTEGETLAFRYLLGMGEIAASNAKSKTVVRVGIAGLLRTSDEVHLTDILLYVEQQAANAKALIELCHYIAKERKNASAKD